MPKKCSCGKQSCFNFIGEKPKYCAKCKTPEMIDVVNKRCPCGKQPRFNCPGEKPKYCAKCKTDEMINMFDKRCPCGVIASFNVPGEKTKICCAKCKTDTMVNVSNKKCPCGIRPSFNIPGQTVGTHCYKCKTSEMVDVISKRCSCGSLTPCFNIPGQTVGTHCYKCKNVEMIDVRNKICRGYKGECPVRTYISNVCDYCMACDPNENRRKRYKRHEEAFFAYIKDKLDVHKREFRVSFDQNETSKKYARIDGIVFGDGIIVCLEVDEDGHQNYECDQYRMHLVTGELLQKYPGCVVSWIRVNPTTDENSQWSKKSKAIREKRFEDVIKETRAILETCDTRVVYIGFTKFACFEEL